MLRLIEKRTHVLKSTRNTASSYNRVIYRSASTTSTSSPINNSSPSSDIDSIINLLKSANPTPQKSTKSSGVRYIEFSKESKESSHKLGKKGKVRGGVRLDQTPILQEPVGELDHQNIPRLAHGLERILNEDGIHTLKDSRNNFQFSPFLKTIHQPHEIDYECLAPFVNPSGDKKLHNLALENNCKFVASTSSMTTILSHLYFLFSNFKPPNFSGFSFLFQSKTRLRHIARPKSIFLRKNNDGIYSIDCNNGTILPQNQILLDLGKSLEKMLTMDPDEFNLKLLKSSTGKKNISPDIYHYLKLDNSLLVRSQLDCVNPQNNMTFDLKTRATLAIRIDPRNFKQNAGYQITQFSGSLNSYERELYDMVRGVFLKYIFQVQLGHMGGIFVAYHNTQELLAFEYFSRSIMEQIVFGSSHFATLCFSVCNTVLIRLLQKIIEIFPKSANLKTFFCASSQREMDVFVEDLNSPTDLGVTNEFDIVDGKRRKVAWLKVKLDNFLNDQHVLELGELIETDRISIDLTIQEVKASKEELLQAYLTTIARSQIYLQNSPPEKQS